MTATALTPVASVIVTSGGTTLLATQITAEQLREFCAYSMRDAVVDCNARRIWVLIDPIAAPGERFRRLLALAHLLRADITERTHLHDPDWSVLEITALFEGHRVEASTSLPRTTERAVVPAGATYRRVLIGGAA